MRMWAVSPSILCDKHLLGEHVEMHMFAGTIRKGISIKGYLDKHLVNPRGIAKRHEALKKEMKKRGMNHRSPLLLDCSQLPEAFVSTKKNLKDLLSRCPKCRENYENNICR